MDNLAAGIVGLLTVSLPVVGAHIIPNGTMLRAVLLGGDSWKRFPAGMRRDVSDNEQIVVFLGPLGDAENGLVDRAVRPG